MAACNADARASENAGEELVAAVLGAGKDNILKEVKTRGSWLSAADAITYGKSPPAPAEGAPAAEKVAGNADASPAPALEEAKRRIAELERKLAASELREVEANERAKPGNPHAFSLALANHNHIAYRHLSPVTWRARSFAGARVSLAFVTA